MHQILSIQLECMCYYDDYYYNNYYYEGIYWATSKEINLLLTI